MTIQTLHTLVSSDDGGFGLTAWFTLPDDAGTTMLYEPRHPLVYELPD